jgi:hypothetical protein
LTTNLKLTICQNHQSCIYSIEFKNTKSTSVKPYLYRAKFGIMLIILIIISSLANACSISVNQPPKISSLEADTMLVYPTGKAELQCIATDPDGDNMTFKWSCTDGTFIGTGPIVTWKAPNAYGDFHIMVIVEDSKGSSSQATLTIGVVVNENQKQGCKNCSRK